MTANDTRNTKGNREVSIETDRRHTFIIKRETITIRILDCYGNPITQADCQVKYDDGFQTAATTDDRGWMEVNISKTAESAHITIDGVIEDAERLVYLKPPQSKSEDRSLIEQKLSNLGFSVEPTIEHAILEFQEMYDLELTGDRQDASFKKKLKEVYEEYRDQDPEKSEDEPGGDETVEQDQDDDDDDMVDDDIDNEQGRT